jgi:DNA gyrase subunit B
VVVDDDGRGIPVEYKADSGMSALTQVLLKPHAGGKFGGDDSAYSSSGGLHGIGIKTTNAFRPFLRWKCAVMGWSSASALRTAACR